MHKTLYEIVRRPLSREQAISVMTAFYREVVIGKAAKFSDVRYDFSPASLIYDLGYCWHSRANSWQALISHINNTNPNDSRAREGAVIPLGTIRTYVPGLASRREMKGGPTDIKLVQILARAFVETLNDGSAICAKTECSAKPDEPSRRCEDCAAATKELGNELGNYVARRALEDGNASAQIYLGPARLISAAGYLQHLGRAKKHLVIPVDPFTVTEWNPQRFAGAFQLLRNYFEDADLRLIYILKPEPEVHSLDHRIWRGGEALYRAQMEYLLRSGTLPDANQVIWFVATGSAIARRKAEADASAIFVQSLPDSWRRSLESISDPIPAWTYSASVASASAPEFGRSMEYAVTLIHRTDNARLEGAPVAPVPLPDSDTGIQMGKAFGRFVSAALNASERVTGWSRYNAEDFLTLLPARRLNKSRTSN